MKKVTFRTKRGTVIFLLLLFPVWMVAQIVTGKVISSEDKEGLPGYSKSRVFRGSIFVDEAASTKWSGPPFAFGAALGAL